MTLAFFTSINWFTPVYVLAIYGLVRYIARPRLAENNQANAKYIHWTPIESVAVGLLIYFAGQFGGVVLALFIPRLWGLDSSQVISWMEHNVLGQFITILLVEAVSVGLLWGFIRRRRSSWQALGLKLPKWRDVGYVLIGFGMYFVAAIVFLQIAKLLFPNIDANQQQQIGFDGASGIQLVPVFISLVILPAFVEELLVRGFMYGGLRKGLNKYAAALITSALFGIAHLQAGFGSPLLWVAAIDTFVLSLVLIYLKEKTGSLAASIGLHMLKNTLAFLSLFVFAVG